MGVASTAELPAAPVSFLGYATAVKNRVEFSGFNAWKSRIQRSCVGSGEKLDVA